MRESEIIVWLNSNIEPLGGYDGQQRLYRCSAKLIDGTELPCVMISSLNDRVNQAIKRFKDTRHTNEYQTIVAVFVCKGNRINPHEIKELNESPYAIPKERMREIKGETLMGWTQFIAQMRDGAEFQFGTTFSTEFFDIPKGYTAKDIIKIIPAERGQSRLKEYCYREKPYFNCYVEGL
jgi:hypothetical protein